MLYTENRGKIHFLKIYKKKKSTFPMYSWSHPYYAFDINNGINLYVGCPTDGYFNGSVCCPSEKCQRCYLDTGTCLVCQPGYKGLQCEQGNKMQI